MAEQNFTPEELANEAWKPVVGYEGVYSVSDLGRVRRDHATTNTYAGRVLSQLKLPKGYHTASLWRGNMERRCLVHRLVAIAFLGMPPEGRSEVNHKNGAKGNNRPHNLEWMSPSENVAHATRMGLVASGDRSGARKHPERLARGERNTAAKLSESDVREMRRLMNNGTTARDTARLFRVSEAQAGRIKHRQCWAHLEE